MEVNICGIPYKVVEKKDNFNTDIHYGDINYAKGRIRINKKLTDEQKKETICHEMVHGILVHIGRSDLTGDETFVQALGNAIYQGFDIKNMD